MPRGDIKKNVMKKITESQPLSIFFITDYTELGAWETIRKIFHEATINGILEKAGHGIYFKPKISRFGKVPIPLEKIAKEIAKRDRCEILPTGSTAANIIGLSTQMPTTVSYITSGSTRSINIGKRKISFRHVSPKNFAAKGKIMPILIQGIKDFGKENISAAEYNTIKQFINKHQDHYLQEDLKLAPQWIQQIIKKLIRQ